jgi:hypothetical protein
MDNLLPFQNQQEKRLCLENYTSKEHGRFVYIGSFGGKINSE